MTLRICVVGSFNGDTTFRVPAVPEAGETVLATGRDTAPGGKGANQAVAAAALGASVAFVGAVGDDSAGQNAREVLNRRGIDTRHLITVEGVATGSAVLIVGDDGENVIIVDPAANHHVHAEQACLAIDDLAPSIVLAQLEVPTDALLAAAQADVGTFVLNPAPMPSNTSELQDLLALTDVLVPNRSELARLVGRPLPDTLDEVRGCVQALGAVDIRFTGDTVVTLGSQGALVHADGVWTEIPAIKVETVDTTGAGDVFCGVLSYRLAAGDDLLTAARRASQVAAASTTRTGAQLSEDLAASLGEAE